MISKELLERELKIKSAKTISIEQGVSQALISKLRKKYGLNKKNKSSGYKNCLFCNKRFFTKQAKKYNYCSKQCYYNHCKQQTKDKIPQKLVQDFQRGIRNEELAKQFNISKGTAYKYLKLLKIPTQRTYYGKDNKLHKGYEEISGAWWRKLIYEANKRNLQFDITIEYLWKLFLQQDRKCKYTGLEIKLHYDKYNKPIMKNHITASLDRIDSTKGYIKGNVQWIHKYINIMKSSMSEDLLIKLCNAVARKRKLEGKIILENFIDYRNK